MTDRELKIVTDDHEQDDGPEKCFGDDDDEHVVVSPENMDIRWKNLVNVINVSKPHSKLLNGSSLQGRVKSPGPISFPSFGCG